jgi:peroxiredoxin
VLADKDSILDSTTADGDGKFAMQNSAAKLDYYLLRSDDKNLAYLILKGGESIHITGDAKNLDKTYAVTGSEETNELLELRRFERHISDSLNHEYTSVRDVAPEKKDSMGMKLQKDYEKIMRGFSLGFIQKHPASIVSLSASQYLDKAKDLPIFDSLDSTLTALYPENIYVQEFSKQMVLMQRMPIGSVAPEIKLKTPEGKEISLKSLKGKVVLVDFWASWCEPCRKENPRMVDLHNKFKGKEFEMLGVSLDDNVTHWKEAITHDHLNWTQVSELKKWDSKAVNDYNIDEIPFTVLIDRTGKIAGKQLHGKELEIAIEKALNEYN